MENFKPISGSCICGEIEYTIKSKPLFTHACHCKDCKKITGSSFVVNTSIFENYIDPKDPTNNCLDVAIITSQEKRSKKTIDKLKTIAGRALSKWVKKIF